jgi:hypothetical protein
VETFVPEGSVTTGYRLNGFDPEAMAAALHAMANLPEGERLAMGRRAAVIATKWGPDRFAEGTMQAIQFAREARTSRRRSLTRSLSRTRPEDEIR